jgi:hypothetical protein
LCLLALLYGFPDTISLMILTTLQLNSDF